MFCALDKNPVIGDRREEQEVRTMCENCELLKKKEAEIAELKQSEEVLFLLLEVGIKALAKWGKAEGLLETSENFNKQCTDRDDQILVLLDQIRKLGQ